MTADLVDLRHRLPRTFTHVLDGEAEVWLARKVAGMSRAVPAATIGQVDAAVAAAITGVAPSRLLDIAEAAVIIADPAGHRARLAAQRRRFVGLGRPDDTGLRTLIARITAGDAIYIDGVVDRVADILTLRRATDGLPELSEPDRDRVRSEALGWLARPAELLALLAAHTPEVDPELTSEDPDRPARAFALPAEVLDRLTPDLLAQLRPTATLYVHLHQDALAPLEPWQTRAGVARPEGLPPLDVESLADLLGHHRVTVKPVIDSREHHAVDAYEHPAWIRERIHLARPADTFPHASRVSRDLDLDHPVPWDPGGPPGQTSTESQPLSRTAHRARTHLGYVVTPTPAGVVWRTPHGLHRLVDPTGRTHRITADDAVVLTHGEDAVDRLLRRLTEES